MMEYTAYSDIQPPLTHKRLQLAARRMANYIMREMIGADMTEPEMDDPEGAE